MVITTSRLLSVALLGSLWLLVFSGLPSCSVRATTFTVGNNCGYTVWPGVLPNAGATLLAKGGFTLQPGQSVSLEAPSGWSGRLWGRTLCSFTSAGVGSCNSGDCGGVLECQGTGATPPATLVEFTLQGTAGAAQDYYDVSLVDGYNVPVAVAPANGGSGTCGVASCSVDINANCPQSLQVVDDGGQVVSCKSACLAFQTAQYCCEGAYASPTTCEPSTYSSFFKSACPNAYSYAYDDPTSTFTCSSAEYLITFCPSSSLSTTTTNSSSSQNSQKNLGEVQPSSNTGAGFGTYSGGWSGSAKATPSVPMVYVWLSIFTFLLAQWEKLQ